GGPRVVHAANSVQLHDTPAARAQRVHVQEHRIYPLANRWFAEGRLSLGEQGALLDSLLLPPSGHLIRH
ncbi:phosphoribosylglycinamide formyltransferase, partial [Pseudomonas syringae pv. tagetis]